MNQVVLGLIIANVMKKIEGSTRIGIFSANIIGLSPNRTYYYKAYAINSIGTTYGNEVNFIISQPLKFK